MNIAEGVYVLFVTLSVDESQFTWICSEYVLVPLSELLQ